MLKIYPYNIRLNLPRNSNIFVIGCAALYQLVGTRLTSKDITKIKSASNVSDSTSLRMVSERVFGNLKGDYYTYSKPLSRKIPMDGLVATLNSKNSVAALIRFDNGEMGFVVNESEGSNYVLYLDDLIIKSVSEIKSWVAEELIYFELSLVRDVTDFVRVGPQLGSNAGGTYEDPKNGEKWYIKKFSYRRPCP